jgi:DNA-binding NarL/FixJ family response regulator
MDDSLVSVAIVEDDKIIRGALASLIDDADGYSCSGSYSDCETGISGILLNPPDVVLMDIELPGMSGIDGIRALKQAVLSLDVIVFSVHENDELVFSALCAGACGYLTKNTQPSKLLEAIADVKSGGSPMSSNIARMVVSSFQRNTDSPLSPRETEVLLCLSQAKSYTMIAKELFIDKETVRTHIKNIYGKLEVHCKAEAIQKAVKERFI